MTLLHAHFHLRSLQAFQRLLDSSNDRGTHTAISGSAGRSWKSASALKPAIACEVNALDRSGRTTLHLTCAAPDGIEYVRALLRHPFVNVNLADVEGHWTALHRALYHGNLAAALLLLARPDIDTSLKDLDGYTAFDLYNSTVHDTAPSHGLHAELYTWGVNRNAALGMADSGDRTYPDQVLIPKEDPDPKSTTRFSALLARQIQMSKLHTVVVTSESKTNLRVCGFGSGGRLGPGQHTQYTLAPLPQFSHSIVSVALGQDHTLALTSAGEVLSWGLSRFHQLGYVVEPSTTSGRLEEPVQVFPRKVFGPLKKEVVKGVAASKQSSACWTATEIFTWGTNNGQLGYDKAAQPVQVIPRKVAKVARPVVAISLTDHAMACLLDTQDVVCIWNDRYIKIIFPTNAFPSEIQPYRPPQAIKDAHIAKITSCDDTFAALSSNGELFTFSVPYPSEADGNSGRGSGFKPQRVWALRKQFSAVRDVALGADGSIIICTESGHVFVRSRSTKVCANSTGAFGALRVDFKPEPIRVEGNTMAEDLATIRPYLDSPQWAYVGDEGDDVDDTGIEADFASVLRLCQVLKHASVAAKHGADVMVHVRTNTVFPAHKVILAARSRALCEALAGTSLINDVQSGIAIKCKSGGAAETRMDVKYLYNDQLLAIWDRRLTSALQQEFTTRHIKPAEVKLELQALARILDLPLLAQALQSPAKRVPVPSVVRDIEQLFCAVQTGSKPGWTRSPIAPDVILHLADKDVYCHSTVLRARCPVFSSFFCEDDWTSKRWDKGVISVNLKHLHWHNMEYVLKYMCCGGDAEIFDNLEFASSVDQILEFMFDVLAIADELLLDRLIMLCSAVILRWTDINNVCYILTDASHFHALQLVESIQGYMTANMETLLESRMLDDLTPALIKQLSTFVSKRQAEKSPKSRSNFLVEKAMAIHGDWLALQDFPEPIIPSARFPARRESAQLSPDPSKQTFRRRSTTASLPNSPVITAQASSAPTDDIFEMDDADSIPPPATPLPAPAMSTPVWKASSAPRVDMKAVMAEAAGSTAPRRDTRGGGEPTNSALRSIPQKTPQRERRKLQGSAEGADSSVVPGSLRASSSPWKLPPTRPTGASPTNSPPITPSTNLGRTQDAFPTPPAAVPLTPPRQRGPQPTSGQQPMLGPVFTPSRQPASRPAPSSIRRVSSGNKAWTQPPPAPVTAPSAPASGVSFVAIQQLQLEQGSSSCRDKRSLREIQEEEKARQEEADFLKWWAAEEQRVRLEAEALSRPRDVPKSPRRSKKSKNAGPAPPGPMFSTSQAI
ncbi:hypothetical protein B0H10DRAFT_2028138 [Mycena sp. CBHHK59/15]|nr:hypothetical protein B0H10DRAFT_2028138 [Mycena sp. CBHHK59/15]